MKEEIIWELRSDKVKELAKQGKRIDGRNFNEYRKVEIETGISENAHGSCRVKLGETDVIAGVKFDVAEPYPDSPSEGSITVGVELMPMASPVFEPGPPRADSIELARVTDRGIRESKAIDFSELCITEGEHVWFAFIDLYIANDNGNLFDACALSALGALLEAKIPKFEDGKVIQKEFSGKLNLEKKPVLATISKVAGVLLADALLAEEKASEARFSVSTTENEELCAFQKGGSGTFTQKELDQAIDLAIAKGKELRSHFK